MKKKNISDWAWYLGYRDAKAGITENPLKGDMGDEWQAGNACGLRHKSELAASLPSCPVCGQIKAA